MENQTKKHYLIFIGILILFLAGSLWLTRERGKGGISVEDVLPKGTIYTASTTSATAQELLAPNTARLGLKFQNINSTSTCIFLQSTSTNVTFENGGTCIKNYEIYEPDFLWTGGVWSVSSDAFGTTTVEEIVSEGGTK